MDLKSSIKSYVTGKTEQQIQGDALQVLAKIKNGQITAKDIIAFAKLFGFNLSEPQAAGAVNAIKTVNPKEIDLEKVKKIISDVAKTPTGGAILGAVAGVNPSPASVAKAVSATAAKPASPARTVNPAPASAAKVDAKASASTAKPAPAPAPARTVNPAPASAAKVDAKASVSAAKPAPAPAPAAKPAPAPATKPAPAPAPAANPAPAPAAKPVPATTSAGNYIITASVLNVRSGAGESFGVIGGYNNGTEVAVSEVKNGWGKVSYHGKPGWIFMNYTKKK